MTIADFWNYALDHAAAFASFGALAASMGALYASLRNGEKINTVAVHIDGRMEQLLATSARASLAEGKETGRVEEMARVAAAPAEPQPVEIVNSDPVAVVVKKEGES